MTAKSALIRTFAGFSTIDPFLMCVHHLDLYPEGDPKTLGPRGGAALLRGRHMGSDFDPANAWRMYHGHTVPGFPSHPHRGFETVTVVLKGLVDHFDSSGASGRYGEGDTQWMTAGSGLQHSEMFPLTKAHEPNTLDLFQIWLNLPSKNKMVQPIYKMFWGPQTPVVTPAEGASVRLIAGTWGEVGSSNATRALDPPPDSWAADPTNDVMIAIINLQKDATLTLPPVPESRPVGSVSRRLYHVDGPSSATLIGRDAAAEGTLSPDHGLEVEPTVPMSLKSSTGALRVLVLQGKKIAEPVAQHGPFVMNTQKEIAQAFQDYQMTQFGGWPWPSSDVVHPMEQGRFAKYSDGRMEKPSV